MKDRQIKGARAGARRPAAVVPGARGPASEAAGVAPPARKATQLKPVAQRVRGKPSDETIEAAVRNLVSKTAGTCCAQTSKVYATLEQFVDTKKELGAVLLTWAENVGTDDFDMGNHTAATATWSDGTYVVDTTAAQFSGGPQIFIGTVSDWCATILDLQRAKVSEQQCEQMNRPMGDMDMAMTTAFRGKAIRAQHEPKTEIREESKSGKTEKVEEKKAGAKKKGKKGGGKCLVTSACVEYLGLPDDCHELTVLRTFRDGWLSRQRGAPALIGEYYRVAPRIVDAIEASPDARGIYELVYAITRGCVRDIESGRPRVAMDTYISTMRSLQEEFAIESQEVTHE